MMWRTLLASVVVAGVIGCEEAEPEPHGGGYVAEQPKRKDASGLPEPEAKSVLGKAKQSAERVINEDIAEYNRKIEKAADEVYPKKP
jgi:hypothetical protein